MSTQAEVEAPHRARYPRPQGRHADRGADVLSRPYGAHRRPALRRDSGRRSARHGDARLETTVPVTLDMMILQGLAVMRGSRHALVVVDMPFGSYEASREQAFASCARPEGDRLRRHRSKAGAAWPETIAFLVERGVPVMGHVGLTRRPSTPSKLFRAQGREERIGARSRTTRARSRRRGFPCDRGGGRATGRPHQRQGADPHHRHRRQLPATARFCAGGHVGPVAAVPKFVRRYGQLGPSIEAAVSSMRPTCGPALSRSRQCLRHESK